MKGPETTAAPEGPEVPVAGLPALTPGGRLTLRVPCDPDWFRICRLLISGVAQRLHLPWDVVEDLKLAISEGCALVSSKVRDDANLTLRIRVLHDRLEMVLEGPPDGAMPAPAEVGEELDMSSMGLFFIQSLMDQAEYKVGPRETARLLMVKVLDTEGLGSEDGA